MLCHLLIVVTAILLQMITMKLWKEKSQECYRTLYERPRGYYSPRPNYRKTHSCYLLLVILTMGILLISDVLIITTPIEAFTPLPNTRYNKSLLCPRLGEQNQLKMVSSSDIKSQKNTVKYQQNEGDTPVMSGSHPTSHHNGKDKKETVNVVLLAGFESFNKDLYLNAAYSLQQEHGQTKPKSNINLQVFADYEIRTGASVGVGGATKEDVTNPDFIHAMKEADIFIGSLIFDYDDVIAVEALLDSVQGPRLIFECATELMTYNRVGSFNMKIKDGEEAGPPPAIKAILSKFSSGKEEDKISGYLKLLKM